VEDVRVYETQLFQFLDTRKPQLMSSFAEKKQIDDAIKGDLNQALEEFATEFAAARKTAA
jgi:F0F1-type ATP synthase alpha subunit